MRPVYLLKGPSAEGKAAYVGKGMPGAWLEQPPSEQGVDKAWPHRKPNRLHEEWGEGEIAGGKRQTRGMNKRNE